jgi:adenosine/AMP kinase
MNVAHRTRDIKKGGSLLSRGISIRFQFIESVKKAYPLNLRCKVMQVSRSGCVYCSWKNRRKSKRGQEREFFIPKVKELHKISRGTYEKRRMAVGLEVATGISCGRHKAGTLMRLAEKGVKSSRLQQTANRVCLYPQTCWPVILQCRNLIGFMLVTLHISGPLRVGYTLRSSWISIPEKWLVGQLTNA